MHGQSARWANGSIFKFVSPGAEKELSSTHNAFVALPSAVHMAISVQRLRGACRTSVSKCCRHIRFAPSHGSTIIYICYNNVTRKLNYDYTKIVDEMAEKAKHVRMDNIKSWTWLLPSWSYQSSNVTNKSLMEDMGPM